VSDGDALNETPSVPAEVRVQGMSLLRIAVYLKSYDEDEIGTTWRLSPAITDGHDFAVVGDLMVKSPGMFSGVQMVCYLQLPTWEGGPLGEDHWPFVDALLQQHAEALTHPMYDYAAMAMRSNVAGFLVSHPISRTTPKYELALAANTAGTASRVTQDLRDEMDDS
jgi:hypothetical protein